MFHLGGAAMSALELSLTETDRRPDFTFDAHISRYLDWFNRHRTDEIGRQCISVTHDHYCDYVLSGNPRIRFWTWVAIHNACGYLAQQSQGGLS